MITDKDQSQVKPLADFCCVGIIPSNIMTSVILIILIIIIIIIIII